MNLILILNAKFLKIFKNLDWKFELQDMAVEIQTNSIATNWKHFIDYI